MTHEDIENIINNRLNEFTLQLSEHLAQTVQGAVKATVNGKIDKMSNDIKPMLEFFNNYTLVRQMFWSGFKFISAVGGAIIAIGGSWVFIRPILVSILEKLITKQ